MASLALSLAAGCRSAGHVLPPLRAPSVRVEVSHYLGSPLSGPVPPASVPSPEPAECPRALLWFFALDGMPASDLPGTAFAPLEEVTRTIACSRTSAEERSFLQAVAHLAAGARFAEDGDVETVLEALEDETLGRAVRVGHERVALPRGVTAVLGIAGTAPVLGPLRLLAEAPGIELRLRQVAEAREGADAPAAMNTECVLAIRGAAAGGPPERETILLDMPAPARGIALFLPSPFADGNAQALAVVLRNEPPPQPDDPDFAEHAAALSACLAEVAARAERAASLPGDVAGRSHALPAPELLLASLSDPEARREALHYLASAAGARMGEDLALAATEDWVADLARRITERAASARADGGAGLAWLVESSAYELVISQSTALESAFEFEALLLRHAGEAGRHGGILEEIVASSPDLKTFEERLVEENWTFLEDTSPASRVRAFEWLRAKGEAPEGYDPLAPASDRRAAILRAVAVEEEEGRSETPAAGGTDGATS